MAEPMMKFDLTFRDEDADAVEALIRDLGANDLHRVDQQGLTGIEILFVGVVAAAVLTNIIIRLSRIFKCGVVVDARGSRVLSEKDCKLPAGTVLVITSDGMRVTLHEPSEVDLQSYLKQPP